MLLPEYPLKSDRELTVFEFRSNGPKGSVKKVILFTETNLHGFYNLAFGDRVGDSEEIDDHAVTNNADAAKVLSTVVAAVYAFTDRYPDAYVYATGSTPARTRLYRTGLSRHLADITKDFDLYGQTERGWEEFRLRVHYQGFATKRKTR